MAKNLQKSWCQYAEKLLMLLKNKITSAPIVKTLQDIAKGIEKGIANVVFSFLNLFEFFLSIPAESEKFILLWWKKTTDKHGTKLRKKFYIVDSQQSFALIVTSEAELESKLKLL